MSAPIPLRRHVTHKIIFAGKPTNKERGRLELLVCDLDGRAPFLTAYCSSGDPGFLVWSGDDPVAVAEWLQGAFGIPRSFTVQTKVPGQCWPISEQKRQVGLLQYQRLQAARAGPHG